MKLEIREFISATVGSEEVVVRSAVTGARLSIGFDRTTTGKNSSAVIPGSLESEL